MRNGTRFALVLVFPVLAARPMRAQESIVAWGDNLHGQCNVPWMLPGTCLAIAAGGSHSLALRSDGSIVAWGDNTYSQRNVPALPPGLSYVGIDANYFHSVALRSDGSAVAWVYNYSGQSSVPALPTGLSYVEIAAGEFHSMARRSDGSVVAWGSNFNGQCDVPALPAGLTYVEIAAGSMHSLARRSDGSVVAWGDDSAGQCSVPALPASLSYVEIDAGWYHGLARRSDGSVVAWGLNTDGQCNVPALPAGLSYVEISAGRVHSLARRSDGSVVAWGSNSQGACNVPVLPTGFAYAEIAAGQYFSVARRERLCFPDADSDGFGDASSQGASGPCGPGFVANQLDCDDNNAAVYPGAPEVCDGLDNDCNGAIDDGLALDYHLDADGDGFGDPLATLSTCAPPPGYVLDATDCDDADPAVHPGATEICNGRDDDCDGSVDETVATTYCTSAVTSNLCELVISGTGTPSASAASGFTIAVEQVDGPRPGLIFYGLDNSGFTPSLWGTGGYLCVKSPLQRTPIQRADGTYGQCDGTLSLDWNAYVSSHPLALGNPFAGGETVWAQGWFRDPATAKTTAMSNGLQFTVCP